MATGRERIGDMLVAAGLVTPTQLDEALGAQVASGLRIGKQLVALGYVGEAQLTQILSNQLSVPWVSLARIEFSAGLLAMVPGELADAHTAIPIYIRSLRPHGDTLYVAMDDPTDEEAIRRIATIAGMPVRPMIAAPSDIRRCIEARYFGGAEPVTGVTGEGGLAGPTLQLVDPGDDPMATGPSSPSAEPRKAPPRVRPPPPPQQRMAAKGDGVVAVDAYDTPSDPPPSASRTLTLLDGTQIALPTGKAKTSLEATEVRHLVKVVRKVSLELGVEEPPKWHDVVQALLDALANRGVRLTREEVRRAWAKRLGSR